MGIWIVSPFFGYYEYWCCGQFSIQAFAGIYFQFSGYVSRNRTAGSYTVSLCLTFWGTARLFPQVAVHITFPPALLWFGWTLPTAVNGFSSVQSLSPVRLFATPWIAACQASLSITNSRSLPKLMSIESVMPSSHLILCRPLLLLPPIPPSIRVFSSQSTLSKRWPKYWSFSFSISPSNEHPGLISFRMDWLDLLAVQGTLKSLLQHHSSTASIVQRSAFFTVQLSHVNGLHQY